MITSDPLYYIFSDLLQRVGHRVIAVPEDDRGIDPDVLRDTLDALGDDRQHIQFFYVATVNNPSCTILSNPRRRALVEIGTELSNELGRAVPMLFDTAYELLIHDPMLPAVESALRHDDAGIVYEIGTLSKILAPAMRIGYVIGRGGELMDAVIQRNCDMGFSAPLLNQEVASYLLDHHIDKQIRDSHRTYREKAARVGAWIDEHLGAHLDAVSGGRAGFYYYLTFREIETHEESAFFKYLARTTGDVAIDGPPDAKGPRVIHIPGAFCVHPNGQMTQTAQRQLRLTYGFEPPERIESALKLMADAAVWATANASTESRAGAPQPHATPQGVDG